MKFSGLTNNQLKLLAMASMLADHVGKALLPHWTFLQAFGRLAFPIFAYMIAEGCHHTRNKLRYFLQLFGLAAGCQLVYFFAMGSLYQSVLVTFSLSVVTIFSGDRFRRKPDLLSSLGFAAAIAAVLVSCFFLPRWLPDTDFQIDYGYLGVLLPVAVYFCPTKAKKLLFAGVILVAMSLSSGLIQWFALLALPLLALYNGRRGKWKLKYLFYIFYPAHLAIIYLIGLLV